MSRSPFFDHILTSTRRVSYEYSTHKYCGHPVLIFLFLCDFFFNFYLYFLWVVFQNCYLDQLLIDKECVSYGFPYRIKVWL